MNVSKVITRTKLKTSLSDFKISRFLKLSTYFEKLNVFPLKNHLAFVIIKRYDIEIDRNKIDQNIVPPGGAWATKVWSFLPLC